ERATEVGYGRSNDGSITVTTCSAAMASAIDRWGSKEASEAEVDARKAKALAAFEVRQQAFNAQIDEWNTAPDAPSKLAESPAQLPIPRPALLCVPNT
ncbi:unnamed protein product, partial [Ectocarpus sp. 13 AM-2016]